MSYKQLSEKLDKIGSKITEIVLLGFISSITLITLYFGYKFIIGDEYIWLFLMWLIIIIIIYYWLIIKPYIEKKAREEEDG